MKQNKIFVLPVEANPVRHGIIHDGVHVIHGIAPSIRLSGHGQLDVLIWIRNTWQFFLWCGSNFVWWHWRYWLIINRLLSQKACQHFVAFSERISRRRHLKKSSFKTESNKTELWIIFLDFFYLWCLSFAVWSIVPILAGPFSRSIVRWGRWKTQTSEQRVFSMGLAIVLSIVFIFFFGSQQLLQ